MPRRIQIHPRKISNNQGFKYSFISVFQKKKDSSNIATKEQQFSDSHCSCANTVRPSRYIERDIVISSSGKHDFY